MSSPRLAQFPLSLLLTGRLDVLVDCDFVACDLSGEDFLISINDSTPSQFGLGRKYKASNGERITKLTISPTATAALNPNTIRLQLGNGEFFDSRLSTTAPLAIAAGQFVTLQPGVQLTAAAADFVLVAATNTLLSAANTNRKRINVYNQGAGSVRLSTNAAELTAGKGYLLPAGAHEDFFITGALYARSTVTPTLTASEELYI